MLILCYTDSSALANILQCSCLKLIHPTTKEELRFTWAPQPSFGLNDCSVGINATFAQTLNLHESDLVVISSEEAVMSVRQVFLTPLSADDYEILVNYALPFPKKIVV